MKKIATLMFLGFVYSNFAQAGVFDDAQMRLNNLPGKPAPQNIVGVKSSRAALTHLLNEIRIDLARAKANGGEHETIIRVGQKLVDFTNQTEPADIFDQKEVNMIREIDSIAEDVRRKIFGGQEY